MKKEKLCLILTSLFIIINVFAALTKSNSEKSLDSNPPKFSMNMEKNIKNNVRAFKRSLSANNSQDFINNKLIQQDTPSVLKKGITAENIKIWLEEKKILNKNLFKDSKAPCLTVGKYEDLEGSSAEKIFSVHYNPFCIAGNEKISSLLIEKNIVDFDNKKLALVIKVIKTKPGELMSEFTNLNKVKSDARISKLSSLRDPTMPQMTFDEEVYNYKSNLLMSIILPAKGTSFFDYFTAFLKLHDSPSFSYQTMDTLLDTKAGPAYEKLGEVLANFHIKNMFKKNCALKSGSSLNTCMTLTHGDLHPRNIFYDEKFIYFIDNETMVYSLQQGRSFTDDTAYLLAVPLIGWENLGTEYNELFITHTYKQFLKGYMNTCSKKFSIEVCQKIKDKMRQDSLAMCLDFQRRIDEKENRVDKEKLENIDMIKTIVNQIFEE